MHHLVSSCIIRSHYVKVRTGSLDVRVLRAGIIGAGEIARLHARGYAAVPGVQLVAVADLRLEKAQALAELHGAEALATTAELLERVDAVSVCTPPAAHADVAIAALRAGKHVLCEKPIARTVAQAEAMLAVAAHADGLLMVGHVSRFQSDLRKGKELVERGRLGRLARAYDSITMPFPDPAADSWYADFAQSGGVVLDLGIHSFDYLAWLFESPVARVHAIGVPRGRPDANYALVNLRFANGGIGLVEVSFAHPPKAGYDCRTELIGTTASVSWSMADMSNIVLVTDAGKRVFSPGDDPSFIAEIAAFITAIRDGARSPVPGADALAALRVALAAMQSLQTGETVVLEPDPVGAPA
jgi:myo-inositol 2-dehydrogenase / D-chiro-inositol 1-dehydrogenase